MLDIFNFYLHWHTTSIYTQHPTSVYIRHLTSIYVEHPTSVDIVLFGQVYTSYQFYVRACTVAGCSDGPSVTLSTAQMPPTQVKAPTLKVLGQFKVHIYCTALPLQSFITVLSFVFFAPKSSLIFYKFTSLCLNWALGLGFFFIIWKACLLLNYQIKGEN